MGKALAYWYFNTFNSLRPKLARGNAPLWDEVIIIVVFVCQDFLLDVCMPLALTREKLWNSS